MELEDDLGDGLGEVVVWIWRANVECPAVGFGGVILDVVLAEIECDGTIGDWEAGCGVMEAVTTACSLGLGGGSVVRHGECEVTTYSLALSPARKKWRQFSSSPS